MVLNRKVNIVKMLSPTSNQNLCEVVLVWELNLFMLKFIWKSTYVGMLRKC